MTVSSLWKALDRAGCGRCVGAKELQDHHGIHQKTNPWNIREMQAQQQQHYLSNRPTLAVDLSIWICEALTSAAMQQHHVADPPLQLVYSRTLRLLNLGIKLVVVVEGKRRIRGSTAKGDDDKFRKRRSGARFWTACERCETMLKALGVPVVRAKAEGEALCALLNQKGIVDGVISNDGDCFLFGAKVLYTKFTIENLEQSKVMRYDASDIRACLDDDDADKYDDAAEKAKDGGDIVKLSRDDLIAFAILTGSDLAGDGLTKVGCRKAIRFIRKCRIDNPLKTNESPAMMELMSWGNQAGHCRSVVEHDDIAKNNEAGQTCGCCGHPGNKRNHKKHGCELCGTEAGEPCFPLSPGGKFRKSLRSKALDMKSKFDPCSTIQLYHQPNENQLPLSLVGKTAATLEMQPPQLQKLLQSKVIIRGATLFESRQFIQKTLSTYLARTELFRQVSGREKEGDTSKLPQNPNRPIPKRVTKLVTRGGKPSCEVQWVIKGTLTDAEGNSIDEMEFSTIEEESLIQKTFPKLLESFQEEDRKMDDQGDAEQVKRQAFLNSMFKEDQKVAELKEVKDTKNLGKARLGFFGELFKPKVPIAKTKGRSDDLRFILSDIQKASLKKREKNQNQMNEAQKKQIDRKEESNEGQASCGDDIAKMLYAYKRVDGQNREDDSTIASSTIGMGETNGMDDSRRPTPATSTYLEKILTPSHIHFLKSHQNPRAQPHSSKRLESCREDSDEELVEFLYPNGGSSPLFSVGSEFIRESHERGTPAFQIHRQQGNARGAEIMHPKEAFDELDKNIASMHVQKNNLSWLSSDIDSVAASPSENWGDIGREIQQPNLSEIKDLDSFRGRPGSWREPPDVTWRLKSCSRSPLLKKRKSVHRQIKSTGSISGTVLLSRLPSLGRYPLPEDECRDPFTYNTNDSFSNEFYQDFRLEGTVTKKNLYNTSRDSCGSRSPFYRNHDISGETPLTPLLNFGKSKQPSSSQTTNQCRYFGDFDYGGVKDEYRYRFEDGNFLDTVDMFLDADKINTHLYFLDCDERGGGPQQTTDDRLEFVNENRKRSRLRHRQPTQRQSQDDHETFQSAMDRKEFFHEKENSQFAVDSFLCGNFVEYGNKQTPAWKEKQRHQNIKASMIQRSTSSEFQEMELKRRVEKRMAMAKNGAAANRLFAENENAGLNWV